MDQPDPQLLAAIAAAKANPLADRGDEVVALQNLLQALGDLTDMGVDPARAALAMFGPEGDGVERAASYAAGLPSAVMWLHGVYVALGGLLAERGIDARALAFPARE